MTDATQQQDQSAGQGETAGAGQERRRTKMVDPQMRGRFTTMVVSILVVAATVITLDLVASRGDPDWFTLASIALILSLAPAMGIQAVFHMHRVAGPAYRIRTAINDIAKGDTSVEITLRKKDYLKDVAEEVNRLARSLSSSKEELKSILSKLEETLEAYDKDDKDAARRALVEAKDALARIA